MHKVKNGKHTTKTNRNDTHSRNLYGTRNFCKKLAPMHVTKIVQFDWLALRCVWKFLHRNRAAFYSVQLSSVSCTSFLYNNRKFTSIYYFQ